MPEALFTRIPHVVSRLRNRPDEAGEAAQIIDHLMHERETWLRVLDNCDCNNCRARRGEQ